MLISIVVPVYNVKEYLEGCVDSIVDKSISDYEIILVDDGSTDGESGELCDKLAQKYPDVVRVVHQDNMGLGGARNTGIKEAKGEYLCFIDSDDKVVPGTLKLLVEKLKENTPDVLSFNLSTDDGEGNIAPVNSNYFNEDTPFNLSDRPEYLLSLPNACTRVWRKKLFTDNDIVFPPRVWYEDIRTTTKLFAVAESIVTIKDSLYLYLQRGDSIMHSSKLDKNKEIIDAFEDVISWYKEKGLFEKYRNVLCRLCIDHVYLAASVRILRVDARHPLLKELYSYLVKEFPDYKKNPYLTELSGARKLAYKLLEIKQYRVLSLLFRLRGQ